MEADKRQYIGKTLTWAQAVEIFADFGIEKMSCRKGAFQVADIRREKVINRDGGK